MNQNWNSSSDPDLEQVDLSDAIEEAYGFNGLGILAVRDVPDFVKRRTELLPLIHKYALSLSRGWPLPSAKSEGQGGLTGGVQVCYPAGGGQEEDRARGEPLQLRLVPR